METKPAAPPPAAAHGPIDPSGCSAGFRWTLGIVLGVLLLLFFGLSLSECGSQARSQRVRVKADLQMLATQLKTCRMVNRHYPTTEQGLGALVTKPVTDPRPIQWFQFLTQLPKDPWGERLRLPSAWPGKSGRIRRLFEGPGRPAQHGG